MAATESTVDVVVLGAGPVGENVAQYARDGGLQVAMIERELIGGECSYYACSPSKALLRPVEVLGSATHLQGVTGARLDTAALLARRDTWVSNYDDGSQLTWAHDAGIEVVRGHGRVTGPRRVEVETTDGPRTLVARHAVVIATGSEAVVPEPYAAARPWTSRDATGVREVPGRLVVVGGGVVACEAATWLSALGSAVTMLVRDSRLLAAFEPCASQAVTAALRSAGVDVRLDTEATKVERPDARDTGLGRPHGGPVTLTLGDGSLEADEVLVATGRRRRLGDVGLDAVGLGPDDVQAQRLPDWLHVIGDAGVGAKLTHMGKHEARVLGERLAAQAAGEPAPFVPDDVPVPQVVFTDPQVASVGQTEAQARGAGHDVVCAQVPFTAAAGGSVLRDDADGCAKVVIDRSSGGVLGATFVGPDTAELVHSATVAIVGQVPVRVLRHAVPSFPTASELWLRLLEELPTDLRR